MDGGAWQGRHMFGSVHDVIPSGTAKGRPHGASPSGTLVSPNYHNTKLVYDPSNPVINLADSERRDWTSSEFSHINGVEELPPQMLEPQGMGFVIHAKVMANHALDTVTQHSHSGFLVYVNNALVRWWRKKQASIKSSSFGSEFIATKQCCEYIKGLKYKLRMMGIPCEQPAYIYGDNQ